jgi:hypothetical protein
MFSLQVHYYIIRAHLLCTNYIDSYFIEVENYKPSPNCAYKWFYGMLIACEFTTPCTKLQWDTKSEPLNLVFTLEG